MTAKLTPSSTATGLKFAGSCYTSKGRTAGLAEVNIWLWRYRRTFQRHGEICVEQAVSLHIREWKNLRHEALKLCTAGMSQISPKISHEKNVIFKFLLCVHILHSIQCHARNQCLISKFMTLISNIQYGYRSLLQCNLWHCNIVIDWNQTTTTGQNGARAI